MPKKVYNGVSRQISGEVLIMKKFLATLLITCACVVLGACGNAADDEIFSAYRTIDLDVSVNQVTGEYINEKFYSQVPEEKIVIDASDVDIPVESSETDSYSNPYPGYLPEEVDKTGWTATQVLDLYWDQKDTIDFIDLSKYPVPDVTEFVHKLRNFTALTQVDMCDTGLTVQQMNAINEAFPDFDIIFNFRVSYWNLRTDRQAFSTYQGNVIVYKWTSDDAMNFRYCKDLYALDLGHNAIGSLDFLQFCPKLRILILADNYGIKDLSPIENCPKLQYVEVFMESFKDISVFAKCPDLLDLNVCYTQFTDLSPLYGLPHLERLWMVGCWKMPAEQKTELAEIFPELKLNVYHPGSTDWGWREHPRYYAMRNTFASDALNELFFEEPTTITNSTLPGYIDPASLIEEETEGEDTEYENGED